MLIWAMAKAVRKRAKLLRDASKGWVPVRILVQWLCVRRMTWSRADLVPLEEEKFRRDASPAALGDLTCAGATY